MQSVLLTSKTLISVSPKAQSCLQVINVTNAFLGFIKVFEPSFTNTRSHQYSHTTHLQNSGGFCTTLYWNWTLMLVGSFPLALRFFFFTLGEKWQYEWYRSFKTSTSASSGTLTFASQVASLLLSLWASLFKLVQAMLMSFRILL